MTDAKVVTRFAPSPTGLLHLGNYRTAVFAYLFARKHGGSFILRIEDTDRERSRKEYEDNIIEALDWLGLERDAIYRQSEHAARHEELLRALVEKGAAYVSKEEPKQEGGRTEVIRFKNPNTTVTFMDAIRGEISFDTTELKDFVIARSFSEPVFHFAVVVDDWDEGVTHVVRGEDHISNTPRQILIQRALGAPEPVYAHLPLVLGPDKAKLSKRRGARALTGYRDEGYLPEAILNGIALVGWHPASEQELLPKAELIAAFDLDRIQKSSAILDEAKLRWFNHEYLKRLPSEEFEKRLRDFMKDKAPAYLPRIAPLLRERAQTLADAEALAKGEFAFMEPSISYDAALLIKNAKADAETVARHLRKAAEILSALAEKDFTAEKARDALFPYATEEGRASVLWPLRVALSGNERSPDPFILSELLGKETALIRIASAVQRL